VRHVSLYWERKCAYTICTVLSWPFPILKYKYIFQIKYTEATLSTRKLSLFEIREMLIAVLSDNFFVLFIITFGTHFRFLCRDRARSRPTPRRAVPGWRSTVEFVAARGWGSPGHARRPAIRPLSRLSAALIRDRL